MIKYLVVCLIQGITHFISIHFVMLNDEQRSYILGLRTTNPDLAETQLRDALAGARWSEDQILEGINLYNNKPRF